ncbi:unnamed protein product [Polarella glacialis]|uniref:Peptidase C14 caspase domain-containing protein n=1 Tax=Polarella glacialis TaxID=89957 RepID=A0A813EC77_POLGL|nr:unnamed protein product [Polarella glacialis]CAE8734940.1 unnamed protein product [Polarella glacialis]
MMDLLSCVAGICSREEPRPATGVRPASSAREFSAPAMDNNNWARGPTERQAFPTARPAMGRHKSLLVGINYVGSPNELHGCIDDVGRMLPLLDRQGFPGDEASRRVLIDSPEWPQNRHPTMANMRAGIAWLVEGAQAGDCLLLHYSGHGGRMPRTDGKEGFHETLCPVDLDREGMLLDTELFETLVRPLPGGCRLTCILDSCHSAGALDLPYLFTGTEENIGRALAGEAVQMAMSKSWMTDWQQWQEHKDPIALLQDTASMGVGLWDLWSKYKAAKPAGEEGFAAEDGGSNVGLAVAEVIAFTGCASDQTSADVGDVGSQFHLQPAAGGLNDGGLLLLNGRVATAAGGALTSAFVEAMQDSSSKDLSFLDLLEHLRQRLAEAGFSQVPQLASSLVLDLRQPFSLASVCSSEAAGRARSGGVGAPAQESGSRQWDHQQEEEQQQKHWNQPVEERGFTATEEAGSGFDMVGMLGGLFEAAEAVEALGFLPELEEEVEEYM